MESIYLVGQISPKFKETYEWRERVIQHFRNNASIILVGDPAITRFDRPRIEILNPCGNPFNQKYLKEKKYAVTKENRSFGLDLIVPKDLMFVKRSTIAIVNMNHYDTSKPMLGSFFELAWYFVYPEKAVIAFADDLNDYQCQHPFVQQAVNVWCNDENEACALVDKYFVNKI